MFDNSLKSKSGNHVVEAWDFKFVFKPSWHFWEGWSLSDSRLDVYRSTGEAFGLGYWSILSRGPTKIYRNRNISYIYIIFFNLFYTRVILPSTDILIQTYHLCILIYDVHVHICQAAKDGAETELGGFQRLGAWQGSYGSAFTLSYKPMLTGWVVRTKTLFQKSLHYHSSGWLP